MIDGTQIGNSCIQNTGFGLKKMSEDCLVLNIWSANRGQNRTLQPVMFFIHGGGYLGGSIFELNNFRQLTYNGSALATNKSGIRFGQLSAQCVRSNVWRSGLISGQFTVI